MLLPYLNKELIEAGCDEAGRGCLAGAVYAAAVILPKDFKNELLNDSKLGILVGSLLAGILGWVALHFSLPKEPQPDDND